MNEKHINYITNKLKSYTHVKSIKKVKKLPFSLKYIDWTIGYQLERDYMYEIVTRKSEVIYCIITTLLGFCIIKSRFFKKRESNFVRIRL